MGHNQIYIWKGFTDVKKLRKLSFRQRVLEPYLLLRRLLKKCYLVDKPTIQFIVEEAQAGIEDILAVTGKSKRSIEDHFDSGIELHHNLKEKAKMTFEIS